MITVNRACMSAVLAASMVFASAASAMTIAEYKDLPLPQQAKYLSDLVGNELRDAEAKDSVLGQ